MKRNLILALLLCVILLAGCSAPPGSQTSTSQSAASVSSAAQTSASVSSPSLPPATVSEEEARQISFELYNDGYLANLHLARGEDMNSSSYITVDGIDYYLYENAGLPQTREELEEYLSVAFSSDFVQRNVDWLLSGDDTGYRKIVEQDGQLYYQQPGGLGGTYELATDTIAISDLSGSGWTFHMLGLALDYDTGEHVPDQEYTWAFNVISEDGRWVIDSYEGMFSDGSGHVVH